MHRLPAGVVFFERGWLSSNNVLISDEEQAVLVDTGYWTHAKQTHALVTSHLGTRRLSGILNTHLHSDHCGGNAYFQAIDPSIETYIPPGHANYVDAWNPAALTYIPTGQHCPAFFKTHVLKDGDTFLIGSNEWRIHAAPGHDPHSVVIFNKANGILISADALWENGFGVVFPEIEGLSAFDEVGQTLKLIEGLEPKLILPGHGGLFDDVTGALARAWSRLKQFRNAPDKHAIYAAKVLLKFKLLEFQKIPFDDFLAWAQATRYLGLLHEAYGKELTFENWVVGLCKDLEKSGACTLQDAHIFNTN